MNTQLRNGAAYVSLSTSVVNLKAETLRNNAHHGLMYNVHRVRHKTPLAIRIPTSGSLLLNSTAIEVMKQHMANRICSPQRHTVQY